MRPLWKSVKHSVGNVQQFKCVLPLLHRTLLYSERATLRAREGTFGSGWQCSIHGHVYCDPTHHFRQRMTERPCMVLSLSLSLSCSVLPRLLYSSWPLHNRTQIEIVFRRKHRAFLSLVHTPTESAPCIRPPSPPPLLAGLPACTLQ